MSDLSTLPPRDGDVPWPSIPGYSVLAELGSGGMGVVYKARQHALGRSVALKVVRAGVQASAEDRRRFRTEAEAIARLQHPGIVQIFEVGEHDGLPYLALEYCSGGSLADRLDGTPMPAGEAAALVEQLARAMDHAHAAGVVHRDLKPANVLLASGEGRQKTGEDGVSSQSSASSSSLATGHWPLATSPKITDFGLAKQLGEAGHTATGAILGTPSYMAPEQAKGQGVEVGPTADVYALGAILYECLTGRPPFKGASAMDTLLQVLDAEPVPPTRLNAPVPADLETVCLKCLRKEPARRYGSAEELAEDLRRFREGRPIQARAVGSLERGWRWCRRNPPLAGAAAVAVLALLAGTTASTLFALAASEQAEQALENERQALAAREELERSNAELNRSRTRLEQSLARSLGRPLASRPEPSSFPSPLSEAEREALWELAQSGSESLGDRFLEEALRSPATTRQLRTRAEPALTAAVGLDEGRRQRAERLLVGRLSDGTPSQQTDVALTLAVLGGVTPEGAEAAVKVLVRALTRTREEGASRALAEALVELTRRLEARPAAAALNAGLTATADAGSVRLLADALSSTLAGLPPAEAAPIATEAARRLAANLHANERRAEADALVDLAVGLTILTGRMEPAVTDDLLADAIVGGTDPRTLQVLAETLADRPGVTSRAARAANRLLALLADNGGDPFAASILARGLIALCRQLPPADAVRALTTAWRRADDVRPRRVLARGLAAVAARCDPREAGRTLAQVRAETDDSLTLVSLAEGLTTAAARAEPGEALSLLTRALGTTRDIRARRLLAEGVVSASARMEPRDALDRLAEVRATDRAVGEVLTAGRSAAVARLPVEQAIRTLSEDLAVADTLTVRGRVEGLVIVCGRLPPRDAERLASRVGRDLLGRMRDGSPDASVLAEALLLLVRRMEAQEATATLGQALAASRLDAFAQRVLAEGFAEAAGRLPSRDAAQTCATAAVGLLAHLRTVDKGWAPLARGLVALTERMEGREAARTLAGGLLVTTELDARLILAESLAGAAARTEPREAVSTLTAAVNASRDPHTLLFLTTALASAAGRMPAPDGGPPCGAAASRLVGLLAARPDEPDAARALAEGLAAVSAFLAPQEAAAACGSATRLLLRAAEDSSNPDDLRSLARGLAALASRLAPEQATVTCAAAARRLLRAFEGTRGREGQIALAEGLAAITDRLPTDERARWVGLLAEAVAAGDVSFTAEDAVTVWRALLTTSPGVELMSAAVVGVVLGPPIGPASAALRLAVLWPSPRLRLTEQQMVDLLASPIAIGPLRRSLLDGLGWHCGHRFGDVWEFVSFAQRPGLDLTSPPRRPRTD